VKQKPFKAPFIILFVLLSGIICGVISGSIIALTNDLPQIRSLKSYKASAITRVYSSDNHPLAEFFTERRDPVPLSEIPEYLKKALLATEDKNFFKHIGIDIKGIVRAIIKDIIAGEFVEGASTLTQQLSKTLFLTSKKTIIRKIKEAILSFQLEKRFTKEEILELYLNEVYFGSGAYGVKSASRIFFNKDVGQLSIAECALIAAMPKAPSYYSPLVNQKRAIKRRNIVLRQMFKSTIISINDYESAINEPLHLNDVKNKPSAPYFISYLRDFLEKEIGPNKLYKEGLTIYSTLSFELQKQGEEAVLSGLSNLKKRMQNKHLDIDDVQCGVIALDIETGAILLMIGGDNFSKTQYNRATMALRQPGSAFKPIVYAQAIEKKFCQNMLILDAPVSFKTGSKNKSWEPENFSKTYSGEITLRSALALSKNIPAVRLIEMLGPSSTIIFSRSLGINSVLHPNLSLALGTSEVSLIELTSAYTVFANMGKRIQPFGVVQIQNSIGKTIWKYKPRKSIVMSRSGAAIITNMLEAVITEGTAKKAMIINRPIAGKTGTTNDYKDALFVGFSPTIAIGVWVGRDSFKTLGNLETGARAALPIWIDIMKHTFSKNPYQYFDIPNDVVKLKIDSLTGQPSDKNGNNIKYMLLKKQLSTKKT